MANKIEKKQEQESSVKKYAEAIMGLFALVVLCAFPLIVTNAYFNILETKYLFYSGSAIVMIVLMTIYGIASGKLYDFINEFKWKEVFGKWSVVDWAFVAFWLANVLSWVFCTDWRWEAFWGTSGRYNGVFLVTIYLIVYFMVTRFFVFKRWYLDAFLAVGLIVCLFGVTDYFQMDIMHFKVRMVDHQKAIYTSTLGNINTYTVYVAAVMVVSTILFATEKRPKYIIWYYVNMVVAGFALVMGVSDNAYLSLAALFGLSPLYLFRTKTGTSRYLIALATFFSVILCMDWIDTAFAGVVIEIDSAFSVITGLKQLPVVVAALWVLAVVVTVVLSKNKKENDSEEMGKGLVYAWIGVIALVVGSVAFAFYDATILGNAKRYGVLAPYVTFNETWGTDRGYVWKCAMEIWTGLLTPVQKMFGYGADTFRLIMMMYYPPKMVHGVPTVYDSVHNEYLNYLITVGVVGMCAYIVFLVSAVLKMWKRAEKRPEVAAVMFVVVAYMVQALININLPVVMPVILQLLAMGLSKAPEDGE